MARALRLLFAALVVALVPATTASAADYGPLATPSLAGSSGQGTTKIVGQGFCAQVDVVLTISPANASNMFPVKTVSTPTGEISYSFPTPSVDFTVTATGQSAIDGCSKTATIPMVLSAGAVAPAVGSAANPVTPAAAGSPSPAGAANAAGDTLPVTGSDTTGVQLRNAAAALGAGVVLVGVAGWRRRTNRQVSSIS
jgi:hypothetical protein